MLELEKTLEQARELVTALEDKKAEDIILLDIHEVTLFTDYFVICSGTSERMLRSLVNAATDAMQSKFKVKGRIMGSPSNGWIAVDFTDIVLHVFSPDQRDYYLLEELWSNGKVLLKVK
ncbi:MAG TPA: ribosome silencing factor [Bacteroidales bacterium]|nr:ribosome silencing factor [Bacteroidales bacterium]